MTEAQKIKKPDWIKVRAPQGKEVEQLNKMMRAKSLHTVCEEASCPNLGNCWKGGHAAFMILGDTCTRACAFCNVKTGNPKGVIDLLEPENIAISVKQMNLSHVVITSVDRDDLPDGGAQHFANTIDAIRKNNPQTTIEVLTPDFRNKDGALEIVVNAKPDIYNHNLETVPRLYNTIRRGARYFHSLSLLNNVKKIDSNIFSKSGIMLGLGETKEEVLQVMDDMRSADIDFITIGQYLQPTPKHAKVVEFVTPKRFKEYETWAYTKGFSMVSSSPLTRSSYFAGDDFVKLKSNKIKLT